MTSNKIKTNNKGQLFLNPIELAITAEPFLAKKRRHKGWIKRVTSLNKEETNEFSFIGEFLKEGVQCLSPGIYIDCSVDGNRNYVTDYYYTAMLLRENGEVEAIHTVIHNKKDWAVLLWPAIEFYLDQITEQSQNLLASFSDEQLIVELQNRGYTLKARNKRSS